ncbi:uncharacterized protein LOC142175842 [Nicotiana tabacum]|uniref:Uncharacterized protein LOC142175842 n=1 Tax=Nicotiana tabacum TaxID=4097 RepID=A0AC58TNY6_TOBAC
MGAKSTLVEQVKAKQFDDPSLLKLKEGVLGGKIKNFALDENGVMRLDGRLCVPNVEHLRREQLKIAQSRQKSYSDIRRRDLEFKRGDYEGVSNEGYHEYFHDPSHVLDRQEIEIDDTLTYEEVPVAIIDRQVRRLRTKDVASVKVIWRNHSAEEATWEPEEAMKKKYPYLMTYCFLKEE